MVSIKDITGGTSAASDNMVAYATPDTKTEWLIADKDTAEILLSYNTFENQRKVRQQKLDNYAQQMKSGDWRPGADGGIPIARVGSGVWELMNGQHRLLAAVKSGVAVPFQVTWYTFHSEADKYAFFAAIDQGAKRAEADALLALGVKNGLPDLDKSALRTSAAAVRAIELGFRAKGGNQDHMNPNTNTVYGVKRVMDAFADPLRAANNAFMGNRRMRNCMMNAECFGVALLTFVYAPEEAQEFWPQIVDPEILKKGTPEYALHNYLREHVSYVEGKDTYSICVANAWNAFAEGRSLDLVKRGNGQNNIRIACTPMDGKNMNAGREIIAARLKSAQEGK